MNESTDVRFDVLVLEIERVLPDIYTDDRCVSCGKDVQPRFITVILNLLRRGSWLAVVTISNFLVEELYPCTKD